MAAPMISQYLPPDIDMTKAPLAYGDRALPKLNSELQSEDLETRQKALIVLCDFLHDPEHIEDALRCGMMQSLKALLTDGDVTVRWKSLQVLYVIACHSVGREAYLALEVIAPVSRLFEDENDMVRKFAHLALEMVAEVPFGAQGVVQCGLVAVLVQKLKDEVDEIKAAILDTLHFCMKVNTEDALAADAMEVFNSLLYHKEAEIRAKAARDIMDLSVALEGKNRAHEVECMKRLIELLNDEDTDVRANCAAAIMYIAVTTHGKYQAIENFGIEHLLQVLQDQDSAVRLNAVKALTCLSEAPEGRKKLIKSIQALEELRNDESLAVQTAVDVAIKVINWKP
jgi:hypothetical protein